MRHGGLKKQMPNFLTLLAATLALHLTGRSAAACTLNQSGPMPICGGLMITPETDTIIIDKL